MSNLTFQIITAGIFAAHAGALIMALFVTRSLEPVTLVCAAVACGVVIYSIVRLGTVPMFDNRQMMLLMFEALVLAACVLAWLGNPIAKAVIGLVFAAHCVGAGFLMIFAFT